MQFSKLQYTIRVQAPRSVVYEKLLGQESYKEWTSAFCIGSYYEGSWEKGASIQFLSPSGGGMKAIIAENRPNEFVSIQHLACIHEDGRIQEFPTDVTQFENYTHVDVTTTNDEDNDSSICHTDVIVDIDTNEEYKVMFEEMWPKALKLLKTICEEK